MFIVAFKAQSTPILPSLDILIEKKNKIENAFFIQEQSFCEMDQKTKQKWNYIKRGTCLVNLIDSFVVQWNWHIFIEIKNKQITPIKVGRYLHEYIGKSDALTAETIIRYHSYNSLQLPCDKSYGRHHIADLNLKVHRTTWMFYYDNFWVLH